MVSKDKKNIHADKFEAAFYADLDLIKQLIKSKKDLNVLVPVPKGYESLWSKPNICVSMLDILNWLAFSFYTYYDEPEICHETYLAESERTHRECINPSIIYKKTIDCIDWICNEFSIINYDLKDYSELRRLRHALFDDEGWLDEDEIEEALQRGFRKIDLDLINEAEKGDGISVYSLVKQGADYKIDPDDDTDQSAIVLILDLDLNFHLLLVISYLCHREEFSFSESYEMLSSLYQTGTSQYILDIVMLND